MPRGVVRSAEDEVLWKRAEAAVLPHADRYDTPYAVVNYVYQRMKAAHAKGEHLCDGCVSELARKRMASARRYGITTPRRVR